MITFFIDQVTYVFFNSQVTQKNGTYQFNCQHGANECYANKYHACAIHEYPGEKSVRFIDCGMETGRPHEDGIMKWVSIMRFVELANYVIQDYSIH